MQQKGKTQPEAAGTCVQYFQDGRPLNQHSLPISLSPSPPPLMPPPLCGPNGLCIFLLYPVYENECTVYLCKLLYFNK